MEKSICDEVKIAEHSRFKCLLCRIMIKKGLPVVREGRTTRYGYQHSSYCWECYEKRTQWFDKCIIEEMVKKNEEVEKRYKEVKEECLKTIMLNKLEGKKEKKEIYDKN